MKDTLDIFGTNYSVKVVDKPEKLNEQSDAYGSCNSQEYSIVVTEKTTKGTEIPDDEKRRLVLHEIIHAIFNEGCYFQSSDDEPLVQWTARCLDSIIFKQDFFDLKK